MFTTLAQMYNDYADETYAYTQTQGVSIDPEIVFWGTIIAAVLALICLFFTLKYLKRYRLVRDTPTSKCRGVFIGFVEVKGTAEIEETVISYLAEIPTVHYQWNVQERWSRLVTETYTDSKGNTRTRTRRETGWTTVATGGEAPLFYLKDDTDAILVDPERASIDQRTVFSQTVTPFNSLYYGKGPDVMIPNSDQVRSFTEYAIPLHQPLYILGQAQERQDVVAPMIAYDAKAPDYVISVKSEEELASSLKWTIALTYILAGIITFGFFGYITSQDEQYLSYLLIAGGAFISLSFLTWLFTLYNNLISLSNRVKQAVSLIDVQYKRRFDLIPNLVDTVSTLKDYEQNCLEALTLLRTTARPTPNGKSVLPAIEMIKESYPNLMANDGFLFLNKALIDAEDRIALATCYYNDITTNYNTLIQSFPAVLLAKIIGLKERSLYQIDDIKRHTVHVDFAS